MSKPSFNDRTPEACDSSHCYPFTTGLLLDCQAQPTASTWAVGCCEYESNVAKQLNSPQTRKCKESLLVAQTLTNTEMSPPLVQVGIRALRHGYYHEFIAGACHTSSWERTEPELALFSQSVPDASILTCQLPCESEKAAQ